MDERITLDKESFMALASESRIKLLKKLEERRMTVTELAKELGMSKPAILRHMNKLIEAGLVKKLEDKRKWVYYTLTFKGKNILHPEKVKIILLLSLSIFNIIGAIVTLWKYINNVRVERDLTYGNVTQITKNILTKPSTGLFYISLLFSIISSILIALSIYVLAKRKETLF